MGRTTISLPDELLRRLRIVAAERRTSMAAVIREALEDILSSAYRVEALEPIDYRRAREIGDRYSDLDIGFLDADVFAITKRLDEPKRATLDHRPFGVKEAREKSEPSHDGAYRFWPTY